MASDILIAGARPTDRIDLKEARAQLLAAEGTPTEFAAQVQILREGSFDFGTWEANVIKVDQDLMQKFGEAFTAGARGKNPDGSAAALPVDIDHETRDAVGWIEGLTVADGKLMASVVWNPVGIQMLRDDTFRHMSVMFSESYKDPEGKAWGPTLWGASVTNYPRIKDMEAVKLAAKLAGVHGTPEHKQQTEGTDMDPKALIAALGLPEDATEEQILEAASAKATDTPPEDTGNADVIAMKAELEGYKASVATLEGQMQAQAAELLKAKADAVIETHKAAGRLTDGHLVDSEGKPNALAQLAATNPEAFDAAVASFPVVVNYATLGAASGPAEGSAQAKFEAAVDEAIKAGAADYNAAVASVQATKPELVAAVYTTPARV